MVRIKCKARLYIFPIKGHVVKGYVCAIVNRSLYTLGYRLRNLDIDANSWVAKNMNGGGMGGGGIKYELPYIS